MKKVTADVLNASNSCAEVIYTITKDKKVFVFNACMPENKYKNIMMYHERHEFGCLPNFNMLLIFSKFNFL